MKPKLLPFILSILFIIALVGNMRSQQDPFKGKRYTFDLLDQKNPSFSETELIKNISAIHGVFQCRYIKEKKLVLIYATSNLTLPVIRTELKKQNLGILNFVEKNISVTNLDADINETK